MSLTDFYVRDKVTGEIHKVGDDPHDSVWVDWNGTLHYFKINIGDGCGANSLNDNGSGFEFCPSDNGYIDEDYLVVHEHDYKIWLKEQAKNIEQNSKGNE